MKKIYLPLLSFMVAVFFFLNPLHKACSLKANSADITFGTAEELTDENVYLEVGGLLPTDIYSFELNINYNNKAFELLGVKGSDEEAFDYSYEDSEEGVCTIKAESNGGYFPMGDNLLATLHLRIKKGGFVTLALDSSFFYDAYGRKVPGTILRYYSMNTQDAVESTPAPTSAEPTTAETTAYATLVITVPQPGSEAAGLADNETELTAAKTQETSTEKTESETQETETIEETIDAPTEIPTERELKRDGLFGSTEKILFIIAGALILVILIIVAKMISEKRKRK